MPRYYVPKSRQRRLHRDEGNRLLEESQTRELLELEQEFLDRYLNGDFNEPSGK